MENVKLTNIHIPNPCDEDWHNMVPTEKGAFCENCQIEVIDFTDKSSAEIKMLLIQNQGKELCAKVKKSQLNLLNNDFCEWDNQLPRTFQSKFLLACVFVFGMTLFTSCSQPVKEEPMDVGQVEYIETDTLTKTERDIPENTGNFVLNTAVKGQLAFNLTTQLRQIRYTSLGDYVVNLMTLDPEYTDAVDHNSE